jgi:hypothetical protein
MPRTIPTAPLPETAALRPGDIETEAETAPARTLPAFDPVPRQCKRYDGWTPERQQRFIEALADTGSVAAACRMVGKSTVSAYYLRRQPGADSFREAWEAALDLGVQRIEDAAMDRALNGVEVPVYSYGKLIGTRRVYNDRLLMFMLRNRAPRRFAAGGARGLSAMDRTTLTRLKRDWRQEWERELARDELEQEAENHAALNEKLDRARKAWYASLTTRTRAAYEEFKRLERLDDEHGLNAWSERCLNNDTADADDKEESGPEAAT